MGNPAGRIKQKSVRKKMEQNKLVSVARDIMIEFADSTGLLSDSKVPRRYLWTDAFAVCNFLELYRQTSDEQYRNLALRLVEQVHSVLGRHRGDDARTGWISGVSEQEGRMHPTIGGLRIGKEMNERGAGEPYDEQLEWDRDGQYYHYLTKWMHALNRVSRATGDMTYNRWAMELAKTAHTKFVYKTPVGNQKRMYWKMSIDLSYPLVASMGQHDPLDGFVTYLQLQATAASHKSARFSLDAEMTDMANICEGKSWVTDDPLGIGELMSAAYKLAQLTMTEGETDLLEVLLESSLISLQSYTSGGDALKLPAMYRLAFREFGFSIGLHAVDELRELIRHAPHDYKMKQRMQSRIENLMQYTPLGDVIETFWLEPANRQTSGWTEHRDINMIMLATSLAPNGYLMLG
jgi:hypothetical protein